MRRRFVGHLVLDQPADGEGDGRELALRRGVSGGKNNAAGPPEYPEFVVFLQRFCQALPTSRCDVVGRQAGTATPGSRLCDAHTDCETETDG